MHQAKQHREDYETDLGISSVKSKKMGAQSEAMNTASTSTSSSTVSTPNNPNDQSNTSQQLTLPNEMAGMVPLKLVIGKLIHQCYADLHELADT
jgi:hypothetical protein